jgi:CDP-2,3-bis-(O-geranylgeranyl)-sn-glycerol synthase
MRRHEQDNLANVQQTTVPHILLSTDPPLGLSMSYWSGPLLVLWLYLPGYLANTAAMLGGKWIPEMAGIEPRPIDGGRRLSDGHRILGDGKTWNGLIGAVIGAGFLCMFTHWVGENHLVENGIFLDPLMWADSGEWYWVGGEWGSAFVLGAFLGLGCMIGDCTGSFVKRRLGKKREGSESSQAPLLDTLPFAICTFAFGLLLFPNTLVGNGELIQPMFVLLILTPVIHRLTNMFGYWVGLKEVPY